MVLKAYKIQLSLNNSQITKMRMNCGASRWAYNYALAKKKEFFDKKERVPNNIELHREINKLKGTKELPWAYSDGISKCAFQEGLRDCDKAFSNFFTRCKKKVKGKKGFPKFKSKRNDKQSFKLTGTIKILDGGYIQLPRIGKVKLTEKDYIPSNVRILSVTISKHADKWFISVQVEEPDSEPIAALNDVVGVDLGIKSLAVCSDGTIFENPKVLKKNLKRLKRKQRLLSKKKKRSKNRDKAKKKLAKLHYRISCIRKDCLHKATSKIISDNQVIVLENLKVSNMMKNHCLAQAIADVGLFEFRRQIEYKAKWYGRKVVFADTFYPSSKICSCCGWKNENLTLTDRTFECNICGMKIDRDLNAATNLKQIYTGSCPEIQACGERSSVLRENAKYSCSAKQEFNVKPRVYLLKK
jgi:putative transposase